MNLRIRQLKQQAFEFVANQNMTIPEYFWENIRHNQELQDKVDAKFAELIVRECGNYLMSDEFIGRSDLDWGMVLNEHFGVKE